MSATPPPRMVAVAIADMVRDRAIEAWHYLDDWAALTRYGVPAYDLRHGLDAVQFPSEPLRAVSSWVADGERGVLVQHGAYGNGKTYSGVRWVLNRHRAGRASRWWLASEWPYDFSERDAVIRQLESAPALVIDDLGDGGTGNEASDKMAAEARAKIAGAIGTRIARRLPTLILSNATRQEIIGWLGGRLIDRMKLDGGMVEIKSTKSLRKRDQVDDDPDGRSPRWHAARRLVDMIGVERGEDGWRIGGAIERRACDVLADDDDPMMAAIEALDLDPHAVMRRALELLEQDWQAIAKITDELGEPLPVDSLSNVSWSKLGPWIQQRIRMGGIILEQEREERNANYRAERERVAASIKRQHIDPPAKTPPGTEDAARELARPYGIRPVMVDDDSFEVRHGDRVLAFGQWSRAQAWWVAAELIRRATAPALHVVGADG